MKVTVILLFVCALKVIEVQCQGDMFSNMMMMRLLGGQMGGQSGSIGQGQSGAGSMYGSAMPTTAGGNGLMGGGGGMNMLAAGAMGGVMGDSFMQMMMCRAMPPQMMQFCMMEAMA